jgi:hypothetical protein
MKKITQIILTADEGKRLTDGKGFVTEIRLPESVDETIWREITEEEYNELQAESEAGSDG